MERYFNSLNASAIDLAMLSCPWLPLRIHWNTWREISVTANDLHEDLRDRMNVIVASLTGAISAIRT